MAYKMTLEEGLQKIHREYEGDVDYLDADDEETLLRKACVQDGIKDWVGEKFPEKRETFCDLASASDGDKLTSGVDTIYDCPTNFIRPAGKIKIGDSIYLSYIDPSQIAKKLEENSGTPWYTVIGYPGAYKLRINPAQVAGLAINYDYFGTVTIPTSMNSPIPISRPLYAVYYALWKLFKEDDPDQEKKYKDLMDEEERLERIDLIKTSGTPNRIFSAGAGFGDTSGSVADIQTGQ